jgi:transposase
VVIEEAGLDGYSLHRALGNIDWITSYIVDAASIAVSRRARRAKTDRIDGEALLRTLMAFLRGEPRVCSMVRVPSIEDEDIRRIGRSRTALVGRRTEHVNRIKGSLFAVGIRDYNPLRRDRRERLEELQTSYGEPLPIHLKNDIARELVVLELLMQQIKEVEAERDALVSDEGDSAREKLVEFKGIGPEFANVLASEAFFRKFDNRRQVASYAGLAPSPWRSGTIDREQGVSKAGNAKLRSTMIELAWLWVRYQPGTALTKWFQEKIVKSGGRGKKSAIVAVARKLLVALWKYLESGVVIEGAVMTGA